MSSPRALIFIICLAFLVMAPVRAAEIVLVEAGTPMSYLPYYSDPGLGVSWKDPGFDDSSWTPGFYGVGYEAVTGAEFLLQTTITAGAASL